MEGSFQKSFASKTANLSLIRAFIREKAANMGFGAEELDKIELAVDEACANIMDHAYPPGSDEELHLCVQAEYDKFTIIITDYGQTFDPAKIKSPDMNEYLAEFRVGGLGVYLMRSLMDEVDYHIQPGVRNEVRLTKFLFPDE